MSDSPNDNLIIEQYKSVRAEIVIRITEHHKLWFYKMASCAAIISFSLTKKGLVQMGCTIVPFIIFVFDFMIINNLFVIRALGNFIKTEVEATYLQDGWETISEKTAYFSAKPRTWFSDWIIILIFMLASFLLVLIVLPHQIVNRAYWWVYGLYLIGGICNIALTIYSYRGLVTERR